MTNPTPERKKLIDAIQDAGLDGGILTSDAIDALRQYDAEHPTPEQAALTARETVDDNMLAETLRLVESDPETEEEKLLARVVRRLQAALAEAEQRALSAEFWKSHAERTNAEFEADYLAIWKAVKQPGLTVLESVLALERQLAAAQAALAEKGKELYGIRACGEKARRKIELPDGRPDNSDEAIWERACAYWSSNAIELQQQLAASQQRVASLESELAPYRDKSCGIGGYIDCVVKAELDALDRAEQAEADRDRIRAALEDLKRNVADVILPNARTITLSVPEVLQWDQCVSRVDAALATPAAQADEKKEV